MDAEERLMEYAIQMLWIGLAFMLLYMAVLWAVHIPMRNAGIVDVGWASGFAFLIWIYYPISPNDSLRGWIITGMVTLWSIRLSWHLLERFLRSGEDGRYAQIRENWKSYLPVKFFFFFEFQALLNVILSVPFIVILAHYRPEMNWIEWAAAGLWSIGIAGESVSDYQLKRFKSDPANQGKTCMTGLWKYSRHPNYFFEWLIWVSYFVFALGSPFGWISITAPILMLYFLLKVTGIPATEEQALKTKGEEYRDYRRTTSAFIPWFRKTPKGETP